MPDLKMMPEADPLIANARPEERVLAFNDAVRAVANNEPVRSAELLAAAERDRVAKIDAERPAIPFRPVEDDVAIDPAGGRTDVLYAIVELDHLIPSHTSDLLRNPNFPEALQPRDRGRAASEAQIANIAANLEPALLGRTPQADAGAPIISRDGVVESGNARTVALRRVYENGNPEGYINFLRSEGFPIDGFDRPVLARIATGERDAQSRIDFARRANARSTAAMSVAEQALADARTLTPAVFDTHSGGSAELVRNRDFVRAVIDTIAPESERGALVDAKGELSVDGIRRVDAAVAAYAYDDGGLISAMLENPDNILRGIGRALVDAGPSWAKMRAMAKEGQIPIAADPTPHLMTAANLVRDARRTGKTVLELTNQKDMFSGDLDPGTFAFLRIFFQGDNLARQRAAAKIAADLDFYAREAQKVEPGPNLFGDIDADPATRILEHIFTRNTDQTAGLFDPVQNPRAPGDGGQFGTDGQGGQLSESPRPVENAGGAVRI